MGRSLQEALEALEAFGTIAGWDFKVERLQRLKQLLLYIRDIKIQLRTLN